MYKQENNFFQVGYKINKYVKKKKKNKIKNGQFKRNTSEK